MCVVLDIDIHEGYPVTEFNFDKRITQGGSDIYACGFFAYYVRRYQMFQHPRFMISVKHLKHSIKMLYFRLYK